MFDLEIQQIYFLSGGNSQTTFAFKGPAKKGMLLKSNHKNI
jgi:hypothetical protein